MPQPALTPIYRLRNSVVNIGPNRFCQTATHVSAHGWRYSEATEPRRHHLVCDDSESLYLGIERTLRASVEAAWRSGSEIVADILSRHGT